MRLQNIQDVRKDISYSAKDFGQLPEKYVESMNSIVRSYIEEINRLMKVYNEEFININNTLYNAEEKMVTDYKTEYGFSGTECNEKCMYSSRKTKRRIRSFRL